MRIIRAIKSCPWQERKNGHAGKKGKMDMLAMMIGSAQSKTEHKFSLGTKQKDLSKYNMRMKKHWLVRQQLEGKFQKYHERIIRKQNEERLVWMKRLLGKEYREHSLNKMLTEDET